MRKETPQDRYKKKNIKQVKIDLNINTDQDIIEWLNKQPNKQGAIKALIRSQIRHEIEGGYSLAKEVEDRLLEMKQETKEYIQVSDRIIKNILDGKGDKMPSERKEEFFKTEGE